MKKYMLTKKNKHSTDNEKINELNWNVGCTAKYLLKVSYYASSRRNIFYF